MQAIEFTETQKPTRKRTYRTYASILIYLMLFVPAAIFHNRTFLLVVVTMLVIRVMIEDLIYLQKFETIVNEEGVFIRCIRFQKYKTFNWNLVDKAEIVKVGFIGYGTWTPSLGTVYNIAGDTGLNLIMKSGKKVVIGTQKQEELTAFLGNIHKLS